MDIFVEQIIKKRFDAKDFLISAAVILAGFLIAAAGFIFMPYVAAFILAGAAFGIYCVISSRNLEFEYSVTNGDLTIDKIINRRSRRHVLSFDVKEMESFGTYRPEQHRGGSYTERLFLAESEAPENAWYFSGKDPKRGRILVVFQPNEKVLAAIRPFLSRRVAVDAFYGN